jgi:hypothetical protein
MAFDNYNQLLQNLLGGGFQGVGADAGGNTTTTGANQYYYNPTKSNLTMANYVPTAQSQGNTAFGTPSALNTNGVTNPWASYGKPEWYNPGAGYIVGSQGVTPTWAATQNWMPSAWGGQLPAPSQAPGVYTREMMGAGQILPGLQSTAGMAPSIYNADYIKNQMASNVPPGRTGGAGGTAPNTSGNRPPTTNYTPPAPQGRGGVGGATASGGNMAGRQPMDQRAVAGANPAMAMNPIFLRALAMLLSGGMASGNPMAGRGY